MRHDGYRGPIKAGIRQDRVSRLWILTMWDNCGRRGGVLTYTHWEHAISDALRIVQRIRGAGLGWR